MKTFPLGLKTRAWLAVLGMLALASCSGGGGDSGTTTPSNNLTPATTQAAVSELTDAFAATLTAAQVVPQRASSATASGTVVIQPATRIMTATLTTTGVAGTAADIHQAPAGLNGPVIFPLTETSRGSGVWTTRATLTEAQYNAFRAGDFYFNVRSSTFGEGEIRGQILSQQPGTTPATSGNTGTGTSTTASPSTGTTSVGAGLNPFVTSTATFLAALRGSQEVPPAASAGLGSGSVLINPANRQLFAAVTTSGIAGTSANIHEAAAGAAGPIVIPLTESGTGSGVWTAGAILTEAQLSSLQAGNFYFSVRSTAFPNGEIRGQILPQTLSLEFITGAAGRTGGANSTGTTGTGTTGTGATGTGLTGTGTTGPGPTGAGLPGTGTTGTGFPGSGLPGTGTTGTGLTGTGLPGTGTTGTGLTGTGLTGMGTTGSGLTGSGLTGIGTTGSGLTGTGLTGIGTTGSGLTGTGLTGIGTTGSGLTGSGLTGIGTTGSGLTGTGLTGIGTTGTDTSVGLRF